MSSGIGSREGPHSFCSLVLEDLHTGHKEYLGDTQQLIAALPRSLDPGSRLTLIAQVAPTGQRCLPQAMRASLRWLLPSNEEFQSGPDGQRYYLACQGRRVVLRGRDVKAPLANSRIIWVYDSPPSKSHHIAPKQTPPKSKTNIVTSKSHDKKPRTNNTVPRSNHKVPRNNDNVPRNRPIAQSSDVRVRTPLENIPSSVWHNSTLSSRSNNCPPVPRNNVTDRQVDPQKTVSPTPKKKRNRYYRRERRAIERTERGEMFNHDARWATQSSGAPSSTLVPDRLTQSGLLHSDPISAMRPAVYPPVTLEGRPTANDNSPFHFDQELGESAGLLPGLYKPDVPDPQHDTWTSSFRANSLETGPPSPPRTSEASSSSSRNRTGIVYPLQPRQRRPDVSIDVEAALPESAALQRDDPLPSREVPTDLTRPAQRLGRKRRRKRSSALYRPAKRSPPRGRWCIL